jgi:hypothetical protein
MQSETLLPNTASYFSAIQMTEMVPMVMANVEDSIGKLIVFKLR